MDHPMLEFHKNTCPDKWDTGYMGHRVQRLSVEEV